MDGHHTVNVKSVRLELLGFPYLHNVVCLIVLHSHCVAINSSVGSVSKRGVTEYPLAAQTYTYGERYAGVP